MLGDLETPVEWFQRVMKDKKLSPFDLCDIFCYGDAKKHRKVPLSHVCEVLFDLEPHVDTNDPLTDAMEEFLFQYSYEEDGDVVVDVKEAIRSLDIWPTRPAPVRPISPQRSMATLSSSPTKLDTSPSKTIMLETKARKLQDRVANLQHQNEYLSLQLDASKEPARKDHTPLNESAKHSQTGSSNVKAPIAKKKPVKLAISQEDKELMALANLLTFDGVKRLEAQLGQLDKLATWFLSLKHIRWALLDGFQVDVPETRLMEMCLGLQFNAQAQLDYKEFVRVLLDLLIYEIPEGSTALKASSATSSETKLAAVLQRVRKYLEGITSDPKQAYRLLQSLCKKYDLEHNSTISVNEALRLVQRDLVQHHPTHLAVPLEQRDILVWIRIALVTEPDQSDLNANVHGFLNYEVWIDTLFGKRHPAAEAAATPTALEPTFWRKLRRLLVPDAASEPTIHDHICKILRKVDTYRTFCISRRNFERVFDQHLGPMDIDVVTAALAVLPPLDELRKDDSTSWLRYDLFMKLVFGAPALADTDFLDAIALKLAHAETRLPVDVTELMKAHGGSHELSFDAFRRLCEGATRSDPLSLTQVLYVAAELDDRLQGTVEIKRLWTFLTHQCWQRSSISTTNNPHEATTLSTHPGAKSQVESVRSLLYRASHMYDLETALQARDERGQGTIAADLLVAELHKMLHDVGLDDVETKALRTFVRDMLAQNGHVQVQALASTRVPIADVFDHLFDWQRLIARMKLPEHLIDVKKTLELYDWQRDGTIPLEDWNRAWRQVAVTTQPMAAWELAVLYRRFSASRDQCSDDHRGRAIDYAHLLMFLMDYQHETASQRLHDRVLVLLVEKLRGGDSSQRQLQRVFDLIDRDGKGYFNVRDLRSFLQHELTREDVVDGLDAILQQRNVLEFIMRTLAGKPTAVTTTPPTGSKKATIVSFQRFQQLMESLLRLRDADEMTDGGTGRLHSTSSHDSGKGQRGRSASLHQEVREFVYDDDDGHDSIRGLTTRASSRVQMLGSLRELELTIIDIATSVSNTSNGLILPTKAFRHFSQQPWDAAIAARRRPRPAIAPRSPTSPRSPRSPCGSITQESAENFVAAAECDPLTPNQLKQFLLQQHQIQASGHLLSQFFLHIGSTSKYFLDLVTFAKWISPISTDLQANVRRMVTSMMVKSKCGGGKVDLDRFLVHLHKKILDSPPYMALRYEHSNHAHGHDELVVRAVRPSLLLAKLHQLNVPIHKHELEALLRHFGMEEQEELDYALFLKRLYDRSCELA
ncbi:TPA: hypothetical protein N0F65_003425 [Lagenidium giganteum]|uniref:EF-hand domain-containing protein n=1 Tax=Lagenidium giganteum TaxID=4803 RepID=A0AAV2YLY2_9STRA|nr:TPA: hypothetical protein N0F65_003425 [Lagenidium giganteum]